MDQQDDKQDLVSVYTVKSPAEAEVIRGALESAGISCMIGGETQAGLAGVLEIDILTPADEAERARKHLKQLRRDRKERHKAQVEKRKAKAQDIASDAIQELNPPPPATDIQKPPE
jgi:hypothetical protein